MKKPNWEIAHKDATQWDTKFNVFCNKRGFWDSFGDFPVYNNQEEWGTPRYPSRPTVWDGIGYASKGWLLDDHPTGWDGKGWPPIAWHGQVTWGSKVDWYECVIMPDGNVAYKEDGRWLMTALSLKDNLDFRVMQTMQDNIEEAGSESSTGSESLIRTKATAYSVTDSTTGGHTKYDINVDEEGVLLINSGDGDHLLIESREVLDCISSLSSKLFDEYDK